MEGITIEIINDGNIEQCRDLCNELMAFQKSQAEIHQEWFDLMTFESRMKASYESALKSQVIVVKDNETPVGYVFSTIEAIDNSSKNTYPSWVSTKDSENYKGFYPDWDTLPEKAGCLSNLYFRDKYRGMGLGTKLFDMAMEWLESFSDVDITFVYVSNGNQAALDFYLNHGFTYSHEVFGGFIKTLYKVKLGSVGGDYNETDYN